MRSELTVQHRLAEFVHSVNFDALPGAVVERTKLLVLDAVACTLGGAASPPATAARALANELGGAAQAGLVGAAGRTSCAMAAFVNGTALRVLDWNDYLFGRDPAHPSGNLPVAL
ncbi:MmgE/PrpD family protein, partial [Acidisphaera sp. L21]|uniref:MmgE/PrpD family protein n=1 Tax=Acidisphaera sp. L21 TaxID=1641851 RepID=UPI001575C50E